MKIYLASSWRNAYQQDVLAFLTGAGFDTYDFRNPEPGNTGFTWDEVWFGEEHGWRQGVTRAEYLEMLKHPISEKGFELDFNAMREADVCVLLTPSGRSAHIEAGYFVGHPSKRLHILMPEDQEPELMYKMADGIHTEISDLIDALAGEEARLATEPRIYIQAVLGDKRYDLGTAIRHGDAERLEDIQITEYGRVVGEAFGKLLLKWKAGELDG